MVEEVDKPGRVGTEYHGEISSRMGGEKWETDSFSVLNCGTFPSICLLERVKEL